MHSSSGWLDPLLVAPDAGAAQATLRLHRARYALAAEYVRGAHVVDCACGTGFGSELLALAGAASVHGADLDRDTLAFARLRHAHPQVTYYEADALRFAPSPTPSVWVSLETLAHLPNANGYVAHVAAVLPPGGWFIASVPVSVCSDLDTTQQRDYSRESFRALLTAHGFTEEKKLEQVHHFSVADALDARSRARRRRRMGLLRWYARHPKSLAARMAVTLTKGFVTEHLTIVSRRS